MLSPLQPDGTTGEQASEAGIEFNAVGTQNRVPDDNANISFGDRDPSPLVVKLTIRLKLDLLRRLWSIRRLDSGSLLGWRWLSGQRQITNQSGPG